MRLHQLKLNSTTTFDIPVWIVNKCCLRYICTRREILHPRATQSTDTERGSDRPERACDHGECRRGKPPAATLSDQTQMVRKDVSMYTLARDELHRWRRDGCGAVDSPLFPHDERCCRLDPRRSLCSMASGWMLGPWVNGDGSMHGSQPTSSRFDNSLLKL